MFTDSFTDVFLEPIVRDAINWIFQLYCTHVTELLMECAIMFRQFWLKCLNREEPRQFWSQNCIYSIAQKTLLRHAICLSFAHLTNWILWVFVNYNCYYVLILSYYINFIGDNDDSIVRFSYLSDSNLLLINKWYFIFSLIYKMYLYTHVYYKLLRKNTRLVNRNKN